MKKLLLLPLVAMLSANKPVQDSEAFVGVWKVKLRCTESWCEGDNTVSENSLQAQTWTISLDNGSYTLIGGKGVGTIKGGRQMASQVVFNRPISGYGENVMPNKIVIQINPDGTIKGSRMTSTPNRVCVIRYAVTGNQ
jgi:hypothetical protein